MLSNLQQQRIMVEQLRREAALKESMCPKPLRISRNTFPITSPRTTSWLDSHPKNPIHLEKNLPAMLSKIHHKFTSFFLKRKMKTHKTKQKNNNRINAHIDFFSVQLRNHCLYFFSSYIYY